MERSHRDQEQEDTHTQAGMGLTPRDSTRSASLRGNNAGWNNGRSAGSTRGGGAKKEYFTTTTLPGKSRPVVYIRPMRMSTVLQKMKDSKNSKVIAPRKTHFRPRQPQSLSYSSGTVAESESVRRFSKTGRRYKSTELKRVVDPHGRQSSDESMETSDSSHGECLERERIHTAWEGLVPALVREEDRKAVLTAITRDAMAYREMFFDAEAERKMRKAVKESETRADRARHRLSDRQVKLLGERRPGYSQKITGVQLQRNRMLRQLRFARMQLRKMYRKENALEELISCTSQLYAPQMRFGEHARLRHLTLEEIDEALEPEGSNAIQKLLMKCNRMLRDFYLIEPPEPRHRELCVYDTKWTEDKLQELHEYFKKVRLQSAKAVRDFRPIRCDRDRSERRSGDDTQFSEELYDKGRQLLSSAQDTSYPAAVYLQYTLRGRAVQTCILEERFKYKDLLEELMSSHPLDLGVSHDGRVDPGGHWPHTPALIDRRKELPEGLDLSDMTVDQLVDELAQELNLVRLLRAQQDEEEFNAPQYQSRRLFKKEEGEESEKEFGHRRDSDTPSIQAPVYVKTASVARPRAFDRKRTFTELTTKRLEDEAAKGRTAERTSGAQLGRTISISEGQEEELQGEKQPLPVTPATTQRTSMMGQASFKLPVIKPPGKESLVDRKEPGTETPHEGSEYIESPEGIEGPEVPEVREASESPTEGPKGPEEVSGSKISQLSPTAVSKDEKLPSLPSLPSKLPTIPSSAIKSTVDRKEPETETLSVVSEKVRRSEIGSATSVSKDKAKVKDVPAEEYESKTSTGTLLEGPGEVLKSKLRKLSETGLKRDKSKVEFSPVVDTKTGPLHRVPGEDLKSKLDQVSTTSASMDKDEVPSAEEFGTVTQTGTLPGVPGEVPGPRAIMVARSTTSVVRVKSKVEFAAVDIYEKDKEIRSLKTEVSISKINQHLIATALGNYKAGDEVTAAEVCLPELEYDLLSGVDTSDDQYERTLDRPRDSYDLKSRASIASGVGVLRVQREKSGKEHTSDDSFPEEFDAFEITESSSEIMLARPSGIALPKLSRLPIADLGEEDPSRVVEGPHDTQRGKGSGSLPVPLSGRADIPLKASKTSTSLPVLPLVLPLISPRKPSMTTIDDLDESSLSKSRTTIPGSTVDSLSPSRRERLARVDAESLRDENLSEIRIQVTQDRRRSSVLISEDEERMSETVPQSLLGVRPPSKAGLIHGSGGLFGVHSPSKSSSMSGSKASPFSSSSSEDVSTIYTSDYSSSSTSTSSDEYEVNLSDDFKDVICTPGTSINGDRKFEPQAEMTATSRQERHDQQVQEHRIPSGISLGCIGNRNSSSEDRSS